MSEERKISDELAQRMAATYKREQERAAELGQVSRDMRSAAERSRLLDELVSPKKLRADASLVIRCDDCAGRIVAHVTYVRDRPMLWTAQRDGSGTRGWLDDGFWGDVAQCRRREYVLHASVLLEALPRIGKPRVEVRLSHDVR